MNRPSLFAEVRALGRALAAAACLLLVGVGGAFALDTVTVQPTSRTQAFESDPVNGYAEFKFHRTGSVGALKVNFQMLGWTKVTDGLGAVTFFFSTGIATPPTAELSDSADYVLKFTGTVLTPGEQTISVSFKTDPFTSAVVPQGSVTFVDGQSDVIVRVVPIQDKDQFPPELAETVTVGLLNGDFFNNYVIGSKSQSAVTIIDANVAASIQVINDSMKETLTLDLSNGSNTNTVRSPAGVVRVNFPNSAARDGTYMSARATVAISSGVITGFNSIDVPGFNYVNGETVVLIGEGAVVQGTALVTANAQGSVVSAVTVTGGSGYTSGSVILAHSKKTSLAPYRTRDVAVGISADSAREGADFNAFYMIGGSQMDPDLAAPENGGLGFTNFAYRINTEYLQTDATIHNYQVYAAAKGNGLEARIIAGTKVKVTTGGVSTSKEVGIQDVAVTTAPVFPVGAKNLKLGIQENKTYEQPPAMLVGQTGRLMTVATFGHIKSFTVKTPGFYITAPTVTIISADATVPTLVATAAPTFSASNGRVTKLNLALPGNGGLGYTSVPIVQFSDPVPATAHATVDATGTVISLTIDNPGEGYSAVPDITIPNPADVDGAVAQYTANVDRTGQITGFNRIDAGSGYTKPVLPATLVTFPVFIQPPPSSSTATAVAVMASDVGFQNDIPQGGTAQFLYDDVDYRTVTAINVAANNGGTGYTKAPAVFIGNNTNGRGASATATVVNGVVTSITVTNGGINYDGVPTVTIADPIKTQAFATASVSGKQITINLTDGKHGAGYKAAGMFLKFFLDGVAQPVAEKVTFNVVDGSIESITLAAAAADYAFGTKVLTVTISPPNGGTATATAVVDLTNHDLHIAGNTIDEPVMYPKGATSIAVRAYEKNIHPSNRNIKGNSANFRVGDVFWFESDPLTVYRVTGPTPFASATHPSGQTQVNLPPESVKPVEFINYRASTSWSLSGAIKDDTVDASQGFISFTPPLTEDILRTDAVFSTRGKGMAMLTELDPSFAASQNRLAITIPALPSSQADLGAPVYPVFSTFTVNTTVFPNFDPITGIRGKNPANFESHLPNGDHIDFLFTPLQDTQVEGAETITLSLQTSNVNSGYTVLDPATGTVTIADDDTVASVVTNQNAGEPAFTGIFTVNFDHPFPKDIQVPYSLTQISLPDIAANWATNQPIFGQSPDFTIDGLDVTSDPARPTGSVTLKAGQTSVDIEVHPLDNKDPFDVANEQIRLALLDSLDYVLASTASSDTNASAATMNLTRSNGTVTVTATTPQVNENPQKLTPKTGVFTLSIERNPGMTGAVSVNYAISGTATSGEDFVALSGTVTIQANTKTATVEVAPIDDDIVEADETVVLTISGGPGYGVGIPNTGTVVIRDDEPTVSVTFQANAIEPATSSGLPGSVGQVLFSYPALATGNVLDPLQFQPRDVVVGYSVSGTATSGLDYSTLTGSITIPAFSASSVLNIVPLFDNLVEGEETVIITLLPDANNHYKLSGITNSATVKIQADLVPVVSFDKIIQRDGTEPGGSLNDAQFTVKYSLAGSVAPLQRDVVISITVDTASTAIAGSVAGSGADYQALTSTITIPANSFSKTITIPIFDDTVAEATKTIIVNLAANAGYTLSTVPSDLKTTLQVLDNEPASVQFVVTDLSAAEGTTAKILVRRTGSPNTAVSVRFQTADVTTTAGSDYEAATGVLSWTVNDSADKTISIPITADGIPEVAERFRVDLIADTGSIAPVTIGARSSILVTIPINDSSVVENDPSARDVGDSSKSGCGGGSGIAALLGIAGLVLVSLRRSNRVH